VLVDVTVSYADIDALQRLVREDDLPVAEEDFGADVRLRLGVPVDELGALRTRVGDLTRGSGRVEAVDG
jgi:putative IMPACT (imprinted ancient) family translation regulator